MGGKGGVASPPPSDYTSLAVAQMNTQLEQMQAQSNTTLLLMQQQFTNQLTALQESTAEATSEAPEITEYDVDWEATIEELEAAAYEDIAAIASWGAASGTQITSASLWDEEPTVIGKSLLAE